MEELKTALVVGFDETQARVLAKALNDPRVSSQWIQQQKVAMERLSTARPKLVILHRDMEDGAGLMLAQVMRQACSSEFYLIMASPHYMSPTLARTEVQQCGADDFLPMPFDLTDVREKAYAYLFHERALSFARELTQRISPLYDNLARANYYQLLGIQPEAAAQEIHEAYHRLSLYLHPDRHHHILCTDAGHRIYIVFKRMTEGYKVLGDARRRAEYDDRLKEGQLRYDFGRSRVVEATSLEESASTPEGRDFIEMGLAKLKEGNLGAARMNFGFALDYEPDNRLLKERIQELDEQLEG